MNTLQFIKDEAARILVVDDEPLIRKILTKYLSEINYIIVTADHGEDALNKLNNEPFDLVLTDLRMPKMGGGQLLQIMSERYPDIPKIVLTGHGTNDDIILALQTGAYDFLTKPITDFTILEHSIRRAIDRKRLNEERKRYIEQVNQINEIISMLNRGKNTDDIFTSLNITLKKIIPFNRLALTLIQNNSSHVITKLVASDHGVLLDKDHIFSLDESSLKNVSESKEVLYIANLDEYYQNHPNSISTQLLIQEGMHSSLVLPLIVNDETRGFLIFASIEFNAFKKDHIVFLESIVGQISFSVQRGELINEIEEHTKNLEKLVEIRTKEILKTQKTTIFALSKLAETRDQETGDHLERIRNYSVLLAQIVKYSQNNKQITNQYLRDLYDSSILHDIGKVGIPDGILLKDGYLSTDEFEIMKNHTIIGYMALKSASKDLGEDSFLSMVLDVILYHHERWDGSGYPKGLKEDHIPLSARIVAIADVYDALTSKRPYKEAFSHEKSIEIMRLESHKYDPLLFTMFLDNVNEFNKIRIRYSDI